MIKKSALPKQKAEQERRSSEAPRARGRALPHPLRPVVRAWLAQPVAGSACGCGWAGGRWPGLVRGAATHRDLPWCVAPHPAHFLPAFCWLQ